MSTDRLESYPWPGGFVLEICRRLKSCGFSAYIVGGAVRDILLGRTPKDIDVTTDARPEQVKELWFWSVMTNARFGTIAVLDPPYSVEVTTFRSDGEYSDYRRPDRVEFGHSIENDLARRDFTINAMVYDPVENVLVDPFGGLLDLSAGRIRAVGSAEERFNEDPLRMMRCIRFASELWMVPLDLGTIQKLCFNLSHISAERIRDEFSRILMAPDCASGLHQLFWTGLMWYIVPELYLGINVAQPVEYHTKPVLEHALSVCSSAPPQINLRLSGLLHDIGKPSCRTVDEETLHFYGHDEKGAEIAEAILRRLKYPNETVRDVCHLIRHHMRLARFERNASLSAYRRLVNVVGLDYLEPLLRLHAADVEGSGVGLGAERYAYHAERIRNSMDHPHVASDYSELAVNGDIIMTELGIGQGPMVGQLLKACLDLVLEDPAQNTYENLVKYSQGLLTRVSV